MNIIQISFIGLSSVFIAIQFKETKKEYSILIMIAAAIIIFTLSVSKLNLMFQTINSIKDKLGISYQYVEILFKIVGISYICEFSSDICKDSGFGAISNQIQIFGKLSILLVSLPVFLNLFD